MQFMRSQVSDSLTPQILKLDGRLDGNSVEAFLEEANQSIRNGIFELVLDCSALDSITANGMHAILALTKDLARFEGRLSVCGLKGQVKEMFEICAFEEFIPAYGNQEEAVARMAA